MPNVSHGTAKGTWESAGGDRCRGISLGEDYAYAKAPPHPSGRYAAVKAEPAATPEAAVKPVLAWVKSLE